jgi:hypothetical protein
MKTLFLVSIAVLLSFAAGCGGSDRCDAIALPESWKPHADQFLDTTMNLTWEKDGCPTPDKSCTFRLEFFDEKAGGKGRPWGFANLEISPYDAAAAAAAAAPPPY